MPLGGLGYGTKGIVEGGEEGRVSKTTLRIYWERRTRTERQKNERHQSILTYGHQRVQEHESVRSTCRIANCGEGRRERGRALSARLQNGA